MRLKLWIIQLAHFKMDPLYMIWVRKVSFNRLNIFWQTSNSSVIFLVPFGGSLFFGLVIASSSSGRHHVIFWCSTTVFPLKLPVRISFLANSPCSSRISIWYSIDKIDVSHFSVSKILHDGVTDDCHWIFIF